MIRENKSIVEKEDMFYLPGLYLMMLHHNIPLLGTNIQWIGAAICALFLIISPRKYTDKAYVIWVASFMFFFSLSVLWSIKIKTSVFVLVVRLIPLLLLTFATMKYICSQRRLNNVLFAVFLCSFFMILAIIPNFDEVMMGLRLGNALNEEADGEKIWNSNTIAITLCFALYAGWIFFMNKNKGFGLKLLYIITAIVFLFFILVSGSRKSLLMIAIPMMYFLYKKYKRNFLIYMIVSFFALAFVYYLVMRVELFYSILGSRIEAAMLILSGDYTSGEVDDSRYYLAMYGLEWAQDNPILGVGINCYRVLSNATLKFSGYNFYAHNNYIELLVDVGIVGLIIYYSGLFYLLRKSLKRNDQVGSWVFILLVVTFVLDMFHVAYYEINNHLLLVILFKILVLDKQQSLLKLKKAYFNV